MTAGSHRGTGDVSCDSARGGGKVLRRSGQIL